MNKYIWFLLTCLSLMLVGCQEKPPVIDDEEDDVPVEVTYKYTYDLTLENYTKFIVFRHHHLDQVQGDKKIEVFFETRYPSGMMFDIEATVFLQTEMTLFGSTFYEDEFPISFTELTQSSLVLTYSALNQFRLIAVTQISGKVKTNDETVALADQANMQAKQGLETMLEKFNEPYQTLSSESYMHVKEGGDTTTSFVKTNYQADPYYHETLYSDGSGLLLKENDDHEIDVFHLSQYQFSHYMKRLQVISKDSIEEVDDGLFDFDDSWTYRSENGDFIVSGPKEDLFGFLVEDDESLEEWLQIITNDTIEISFIDLDTRLLVSIELWIGIRQLKTETYYSFNTFNPVDLSTYTVLPPNDPTLIDQITDLSQTQKGYLEPFNDSYYKIEVTGGTYVFDLSYPVDIEVYDHQGNLIEPLLWVTNYASDKKYHFESGTYYIKMYHHNETPVYFTITMNHLESLYESIGSPTDTIELVDGFLLEVEGKYDDVYMTYNALEDGYVVLKSNDDSPLKDVYVYNETLIHNDVAYTINGEVRVFVEAGLNSLKITAPEALTSLLAVTFEVKA